MFDPVKNYFRKKYMLSGSPPRLYEAKSGRIGKAVKVFEPYPESLPLESGYYTFVLDECARFRVQRGNTSSHSGMVGGGKVGAAGHFWISRSGKVGRVFCTSRDYRFWVSGPSDRTVEFVVRSFVGHQAFDVSEHAVFQFSLGLAESFYVGQDLHVVDFNEIRQKLLDDEGQGLPRDGAFSESQYQSFLLYTPEMPPRLYTIVPDQESETMEFGYPDKVDAAAGELPFGKDPGHKPLSSGKKAFILNEDGWLVIGGGHQLLSGGLPVGAAGQLVIDDVAQIVEVNLNFSGHYQPKLTGCYARYAYRVLVGHPLLQFSPNCRINGRIFRGMDVASPVLQFEPNELLLDDLGVEMRLGECEEFDSVSDNHDELSDDSPGWEDFDQFD